MNRVISYVNYFRTLTELHPDINQFFMMDINEPLTAFHSDMKFPALILNTVNGTLSASNADNVLDNSVGGFLILGFLDDLTDFYAEMELLDRMKYIGFDVILKMNHDAQHFITMGNTAIHGFNLNSVTYQMIDGIWDKCFGFLFSFKLSSSLDQTYLPERWRDLTAEQDITRK